MSLDILFLTARFPYPVVGGDRLKPYNIISYLAGRHNVTLVSFYQGKVLPDEYRKAVEGLGVEVHYIPLNPLKASLKILNPTKIRLPFEIAYYTQSEYRRKVENLLKTKNFDLAFSFFMRTAEYIKDKPLKKILMAEDCRTLYQKRSYEKSSSLKQKAVRFREYRALRKYEPEIVNYFDITTLVTDDDIVSMQTQNAKVKYRLLSNGTDINKFVPLENNYKQGILFAGKLDVWANVLMIQTIVNEIMPLVWEKVPEAVLNIVGANPPRQITALASEKVNIIPNVPDMKPYLQNASLFLHPHNGGSGIQNKLLEAMACGCPVVTTPTGNQGIAALDGFEVLIGKNIQELVNHTIRILKNKEFATFIGRNARLHIEKNHSWEAVHKALDNIIDELVSSHVQIPPMDETRGLQ